jgi:hypothetical protein
VESLGDGLALRTAPARWFGSPARFSNSFDWPHSLVSVLIGEFETR